jgi:hypothetical protein
MPGNSSNGKRYDPANKQVRAAPQRSGIAGKGLGQQILDSTLHTLSVLEGRRLMTYLWRGSDDMSPALIPPASVANQLVNEVGRIAHL